MRRDDLAVETLDRLVREPDSRFRLAVIEELGAARFSARAARPLRRLVKDDSDPRVRAAAYEALVERNDPGIVTIPIGEAGFALDLIAAPRPNLIYAKRTGDPRIALIGDSILARPPLMYTSADGTLDIVADSGAVRLMLVRRSAASGEVSPPVHVDLDLSKVIALMAGSPPESDSEPVRGLGID